MTGLGIMHGIKGCEMKDRESEVCQKWVDLMWKEGIFEEYALASNAGHSTMIGSLNSGEKRNDVCQKWIELMVSTGIFEDYAQSMSGCNIH